MYLKVKMQIQYFTIRLKHLDPISFFTQYVMFLSQCLVCHVLVYCLAPPILLSNYWLICPTCPPRYPPLFSFLFSLPVFAVLCLFVVNVMGVMSCACHVMFLDLVLKAWISFVRFV